MHHQPVTQPLRDKLRDAGFAPPEPAQKPQNRRHKKSDGKNQPCKENVPMSDQTQTQTQAPETTTNQQQPDVPAIPDPVMAQIDKVTEALARRIEGAPQREVDWKGIATFGMKTAIVVGGVAATTAAVVLITRATSDTALALPSTDS